MTPYKLTCFNDRGRAELIRWIFKVAQIEFEEIKASEEKRQEVKPNTSFGDGLSVEIEGKTYYHCSDICRYLATKYGLNATSLEDQARIDMIVESCTDTSALVTDILNETDKEIQEEKKRKYQHEQLPTFMTYLDKILKENNGGQGWFVGDKMSWADLTFVFYTTYWLDSLNITPCWEEFPLLESLKDKVQVLPFLQK